MTRLHCVQSSVPSCGLGRGLGWVVGPSFTFAMGWVGLGQFVGGLGWAGSKKMDPRTSLIRSIKFGAFCSPVRTG